MKIELPRDLAEWVEAEVAAGAFSSVDEVVRHAVTELRANALRATLDAAVVEGGSYTTSDVRRYVRAHLDNRNASEVAR